ncbi:hypothetical protein AcV7_003956 [Taiwanofungus camphoratus]|nr:hypothetical protein AcV7_003956 [Antrodia cinnamomea]
MPSGSRHVRFVDDIPPTPSSTNTTILSSAGPLTPRLYGTRIIPLPSVAEEQHEGSITPSPLFSFNHAPLQVQLHAILAIPSPLVWDLRFEPRTASVSYGNTLHRGSLSPALLAEPVTRPERRLITLASEGYPWKIEVAPSSRSTNSPTFVTVDDMLCQLYRNLRQPVTPAEYNTLTERAKEAVTKAYRARCSRIMNPEERKGEEKKGVKRIDYLKDAHFWNGLMLCQSKSGQDGRPGREVAQLYVRKS